MTALQRRPLAAAAVAAVAAAAAAAAALMLAAGAARAGPAPPGGFTCEQQRLEVTQHTLDSPLRYIWHMDENGDTLIAQSAHLTAYRSKDGGSRWGQLTQADLGVANAGDARFTHLVLASGWSSLHRSKVSFYMMAALDDSYWTTRDGGEHFTYHKGNYTQRDWWLLRVIPNPGVTEQALAIGRTKGCRSHDDSDCAVNLYLTTDMGETWKLLKERAIDAVWAGVNVLYLGATGADRHSQRFFDCYANVCDLYRASGIDLVNGTAKHTFSLEHGAFRLIDMAHNGHMPATENHEHVIIIYQRVLENGVLRTRLLLSEDFGTTYEQAEFPSDVDVDSPLVYDAERGSVFISILDRDPAMEEKDDVGDIYSSDSSGRVFTRSLRFSPRNDWVGDFERVHGLYGIYIANAYRPSALPDEPDLDDLRTYITYDLGTSWSHLKPPRVDSEGAAVECDDDECHLHLLGLVDEHMRDEFQGLGRFYAVPSAVGLLFGTGNVGDSLDLDYESELNTYFSRDAGDTWQEVAKGIYSYEIADHGGILALVRRDRPSAHILYSFSEGATWKQCNLTGEVFELHNLITELSFTAQKFVVYGLEVVKNDDNSMPMGEGSRKGVLLGVDFHGPFLNNVCRGFDAPGTPDSDFELWTPRQVAQGCVLGQRTQYVRRKQNRECLYAPEVTEEKLHSEPCPCALEDFECDECYERDAPAPGDQAGAVQPCVRVPGKCTPPSKAKQCSQSKVWYESTGYRLVAGNGCDVTKGVGPKLVRTKHDCAPDPIIPGVTHPNSVGIIIAILLLVVVPIAFIVIVCFTKRPAAVYTRLQAVKAKIGGAGGGGDAGPRYARLGGGKGDATSFLDDDDLDTGDDA